MSNFAPIPETGLTPSGFNNWIRAIDDNALKLTDLADYARRTVVDVRDPDFDAPLDGVTDATAEIQGAIDSLGGERGIVLVPGHGRCASSLDLKRANLVGIGIPGVSGGGGSRLDFDLTAGISSSINDNFGFAIRDIMLRGSSSATQNGQTLVDFTGQNYPRMSNVRLQRAETGLKLSTGGVVQCHYGLFLDCHIEECWRGVDIGDVSNSHKFVGGRFRVNVVSAYVGDSNNIVFSSSFEAHTSIGVDSAGDDITLLGCRFEASSPTAHVRLRAGAGDHYDIGSRWSSGTALDDSAAPGQLHGWGRRASVAAMAVDRRTHHVLHHASFGDIATSQQVRARVKVQNRMVQVIKVTVAAGWAASNSGANHGYIEKTFGFFIDSGTQALSLSSNSVGLAQTLATGDVTLTAVGAGDEVDITVKNPGANSWTAWSVALDATRAGGMADITSVTVEAQ